MSAPTVETVPAQRLRIVVGRKHDRGPLVVEYPQMSQADKAAHAAASVVRTSPCEQKGTVR